MSRINLNCNRKDHFQLQYGKVYLVYLLCQPSQAFSAVFEQICLLQQACFCFSRWFWEFLKRQQLSWPEKIQVLVWWILQVFSLQLCFHHHPRCRSPRHWERLLRPPLRRHRSRGSLHLASTNMLSFQSVRSGPENHKSVGI